MKKRLKRKDVKHTRRMWRRSKQFGPHPMASQIHTSKGSSTYECEVSIVSPLLLSFLFQPYLHTPFSLLFLFLFFLSLPLFLSFLSSLSFTAGTLLNSSLNSEEAKVWFSPLFSILISAAGLFYLLFQLSIIELFTSSLVPEKNFWIWIPNKWKTSHIWIDERKNWDFKFLLLFFSMLG